MASALVVIILTALFSIPVAYFLTYHSPRYSNLLEPLLIDIPQTFPPVAVGVVYLFMLGPGSPINIAFTFAAVVIAKLLVSAPFTIGYTLRKFREIRDSKLDLVARSLGANTSNVVSRILVPLARRDIAAGLTLSWARAMGEFGGSLIFAPPHPSRAPRGEGRIPFELFLKYTASQDFQVFRGCLAAALPPLGQHFKRFLGRKRNAFINKGKKKFFHKIFLNTRQAAAY